MKKRTIYLFALLAFISVAGAFTCKEEDESGQDEIDYNVIDSTLLQQQDTVTNH